MKPGLALAYRGLGLVSYANKEYQQAAQHLDTYLATAESPHDRLYVERIIRNCKKRDVNND